MTILWVAAAMLLPRLASALALGASHDDLRLAYIDPGTGSFVIQAIIAALAGIAVTLRLYWDRVKSFFGLASKGDDEDD